jgi:vancomycin permeability regulator SanA
MSIWLRRIRITGITFLVIYALCAILIAIDGLFEHLEIADTGIVFGNTIRSDGHPSPRLQARLDKAIELYNNGTIKNIIVSGGLEPNGFNEATVMMEYLVEKNIPPERIILDSNGNDTYSTAKNCTQIMHEKKFQSVILISQYFHLPRAKLAFERFGDYPIYTAHANFFELRDFYSLVREVVAYVVYWVRKY